MSTKIELTLACGDYEIMRALKEGTVQPDGIDLKVVNQMDSPTRHWRFLRGNEFDMAEVSSSSYIASRDIGHPFRAIPVFPHRRFRHGFVYINTSKGIKGPKDLIGKKVGVKFFLNSAALWHARLPPARLWRAVQIDGMVQRARRGHCRDQIPRRPQAHEASGRQKDRRHAGLEASSTSYCIPT